MDVKKARNIKIYGGIFAVVCIAVVIAFLFLSGIFKNSAKITPDEPTIVETTTKEKTETPAETTVSETTANPPPTAPPATERKNTSGYGRLPAVYIETEGRQKITSKINYINGSFEIKITGKTTHDIEYSLPKSPMQIRGRGHSTWEQWAKKPYRIKFDEKTSLFGLPEARDWILLANYNDKSLIRPHIASVMGNVLTNLPYNPQTVIVDVFINGSYNGVYTLSEQIEVTNGRLEIDISEEDDTGYLLEIGGTEQNDAINKDYIHTGLIKFAAVKYPKKGLRTDEQMAFICDYVRDADRAVTTYGGYEEYIDIPSFIDWFILHELTYNFDSCFRRSCFMTKDTGGKLKMGPPWDFDLAFGNYSKDKSRYKVWATVGEDSEDSYVKVTWMNYLLQDENFKAKLKARWSEVGNRVLNTALNEINLCEKTVYSSAMENFKTWKILNGRAGWESNECANIKTFTGQIDYLRSFLKSRKAWMDKEIN